MSAVLIDQALGSVTRRHSNECTNECLSVPTLTYQAKCREKTAKIRRMRRGGPGLMMMMTLNTWVIFAIFYF